MYGLCRIVRRHRDGKGDAVAIAESLQPLFIDPLRRRIGNPR